MAKYRKYILVISLLLVILFTGRAFKNIGNWLSRSDTPKHADLIICLNGEHRIAKAARLYHEAMADTVLLTVHKTARILVNQGVPASAVHLLPGVRTTFEEALAARDYVSKHPAATALVVSDPYHMSRVRWSFEKTFRKTETRLVFVASDLSWPQHDWYHDPFVRYQVVSELSKIIFYRTYYGLLGQKTAPDWVFKWKRKYLRFLKKVLID